MRTVETCLLLSTSCIFIDKIQEIADNLLVHLKVENSWNERYRVNEDIVICGAKYIQQIHKEYYNKIILILSENDDFNAYLNLGINRFIFNYDNAKELSYAFVRQQKEVVSANKASLVDILHTADTTLFNEGDYYFDFKKNNFAYKGIRIYLCETNQKYLAEWLLLHKKDNNKRIILYNLRKKFGKEFLSDIDKNGKKKQ